MLDQAVQDLPKVWRELLRAIVEAAGNVDFGCDFRNGKCKKRRRFGPDVSVCCEGYCANNDGFFDYVCEDGHLTRRKIRKLIADMPETCGFLSPTGCSLPRHLRSAGCNFYTCSSLSKDVRERMNRYQNCYRDVYRAATNRAWN